MNLEIVYGLMDEHMYNKTPAFFKGAGGVEAGLWDRVWQLCALPGSRH